MATITLKNIPERVYTRLKELAKLRHRSLNSEIISCLEQATDIAMLDPAEVRLRASVFRSKFSNPVLTEDKHPSRGAK